MGARAEICLKFGPCNGSDGGEVWMYGHWWGDGWPSTLANALKRRQRWDDPNYLARIIVSEAVKENGIDEETGLGIAPYSYDSDGYETVFVDLDAQRVTVGAFEWSFEEFVEHMERQGGAA